MNTMYVKWDNYVACDVHEIILIEVCTIETQCVHVPHAQVHQSEHHVLFMQCCGKLTNQQKGDSELDSSCSPAF